MISPRIETETKKMSNPTNKPSSTTANLPVVVNEDIAASSKEFITQTESILSSYRRGTKANELSLKTQRPLIDISASLTKGAQSLSELENAPDVMKSHAGSANAAKFQVIQSAKAMSECHHKLLSAWGHVTGARE